MRGRDARIRVCAALGLAMVVGACGRPALLDVERVEAHLSSHLAEIYSVEVEAVSCPERIEVEAGSSFRCTVTVEGDLDVGTKVEQADDDGRLEVTPDAAILSTATIEADIASTLADRFERPDVAVTCDGPPVRAEEPGSTFGCEAADGDEMKAITVKVRDVRGALTYTLEPAAGSENPANGEPEAAEDDTPADESAPSPASGASEEPAPSDDTGDG